MKQVNTELVEPLNFMKASWNSKEWQKAQMDIRNWFRVRDTNKMCPIERNWDSNE